MTLRQSSRAFSLLELLVTLCIIAIVGALALPSFNFFTRWQLRTEAQLLAVTMRYVQQKAIATGRTHTIVFNLASQSYTFAGLSNTLTTYTLPRGVRYGALPGVLGPPSAPRTSITSPITFQHTTLTCFPDGIMSAGVVYLCTNCDQMAISSGVSATSYIRAYAYTNGRWKQTTT